MRRLAMVGMGCLVWGAAHAASFDCAKARREDERMVCATPELSGLDDQLAAAYQRTLAALPDRKKPDFKAQQMAWLKERGRCGDGVSCLKDMYSAQLRYVSSDGHQIAGVYDSGSLTFTVAVDSDGAIEVRFFGDRDRTDFLMLGSATHLDGGRLIFRPEFTAAATARGLGRTGDCTRLSIGFAEGRARVASEGRCPKELGGATAP